MNVKCLKKPLTHVKHSIYVALITLSGKVLKFSEAFKNLLFVNRMETCELDYEIDSGYILRSMNTHLLITWEDRESAS